MLQHLLYRLAHCILTPPKCTFHHRVESVLPIIVPLPNTTARIHTKHTEPMAWRRLGLVCWYSFHPSLELTKKFDCHWTGVFSLYCVERYVEYCGRQRLRFGIAFSQGSS
jgi:hypothetical protein